MAYQQLEDGRVLVTDPITGKKSILSQSSYARVQLTRERDNQNAMRTGAPPVAQGAPKLPDSPAQVAQGFTTPGRYQTADRTTNVARAKADGQFDSMRSRYNAANKDTQMDEAGTIASRAPAAQGEAPASPAAPDQAKPKEPPPTFANVQVAAGPNISNAATGLPEGSIGYARQDGRYTVRSADGTTRDFVNEAEAKSAHAAPKPPQFQTAPASPAPAPQPFAIPSSPRADASPDAASQAWADSSSERFVYQDQAREPAATPVVPISAPAQVATSPAPAAQPSAALQAVVAAATQPPRPAPTPTNAPSAPVVRTGAGRLSDVGDAFTAPFRAVGAALDSARITPERAAADYARRKDNRAGKTYRPDGMMSPPVTIPGSVLNPNRDAGSVPKPPRFGDEEPAAFPTLPGSSGASRPRASFA